MVLEIVISITRDSIEEEALEISISISKMFHKIMYQDNGKAAVLTNKSSLVIDTS